MKTDSNYYNAEGYADPTAYELIREENEIENEAKKLAKVLNYIVCKSGFEFARRLELKHIASKRLFR